jgi:tetratricopeptide (TPR) repeat protein
LIDPADCPIALPSRAYVILLYILEGGHEVSLTRAQLAHFLWRDGANASANLRQLLHRVANVQRRSGIELIRYDETKVGIASEVAEIDYLGFKPALQSLTWSNCLAVFDRYRAELLADVKVDDGELTGWLAQERSAARLALTSATARLLETPEWRANPATTQELAARLRELEPYDGAADRALMRAAALTATSDVVTAIYNRHCDFLLGELDTTPDRATTELYTGLIAEARPRSSPTARVAIPSAENPIDLSKRVRLPNLIILPPQREDFARDAWHLAKGILEDTAEGLSNLKTVALLGTHTGWALSNGRLDDAAVERYNVGYVLNSALRRRNGADYLTVSLFRSGNREIMWVGTFSLADGELSASHKALAGGLTLSLADAVERHEFERLSREPDPQAYFHFLRGKQHLHYMDLRNVNRALEAFRQAIRMDPGFAPAVSGVARALQRRWLVMGHGDTALLERAEEAGARAVSLDHRDARGYRELALCSLYRRRWDDAVANFTEAERLGPQHADLISDFGDTLGHAGEPEKGLEKVMRAMELNPIPPDQYWWNAAGLHFQLRDYAAAIEAIDRMTDPLPALRIAAAAWAYLGEKKQAHKSARRFLHSYPGFRIDQWLAIVPDRDPADLRHYEVGLKMAGFK